MRMLRLAFMNFKNSFRSYLSLVVSLSFTILILLNFQNIIYSDAFLVLGQRNKDYIDMLVQAVSVVLVSFMFFFIWYATNVFLTRRKKEIGIFIFMGMSNRKIGSLYIIEISLVGFAALVSGIVFGALFSGLFQMIMGTVSETEINVSFLISFRAAKKTIIIFLVIYLIFALKGYWNIIRSSVLSMISASRQNEYVRMNSFVLMIRTAFGIVILASGYYFANRGGRYDMLENTLLAVILVIIGVFLVFGGLIPFVFQTFSGRKEFLYRKQRCLWVNQMIFRIRKNYRTYAMVSVIGISGITALATGFAMKERYHNMIAFDNQYTFQLLTNQTGLEEKGAELIKSESDIVYQTSLDTLSVDTEHFVLAYSEVKRIAKESGVEFALQEPADNETVFLSHQILLSFFTSGESVPVTIGGKTYQETGTLRNPYLGYMQKQMGCFYIVSDNEYKNLKAKGNVLHIHNYKIGDDTAFKQARAALDTLISNTDENYTGRVAIDPFDNDIEWVKVLHTLCIFMFLVFIVAGGCIMFMKLYNDSFEEKERYLVLKKIGCSSKTLSASIANELLAAYALPFIVMAVSAYFSVHALGKMMFTSLFAIYAVSTVAVLAVFALCYAFSIIVYRKNVGV